MTQLSETYGSTPLYKCGVDDEKTGRAIQDFVKSGNQNVQKRAYFYLRAVFNGRDGYEILHLIPVNAGYEKTFKERAEKFDKEFPPEHGTLKLSKLFSEPA